MDKDCPALLSPLSLRGVSLRNRIVISPLQEYAAGKDGKALDFHFVHLGRFALGGAGLVFTEALAVSEQGRLTYSDLGIWHDRHIQPLARIAEFLRAHGAAAGAQLVHAGRKASVQRPWHGYGPLSETDVKNRGEQPWPTIAPSPLAAMPGWPLPVEMSADECKRAVESFAKATQRLRQADFDVLNIHAAHGYLIHSFLSPISNQRTDDYGGDRDGRMRFALEVAAAVRSEWPSDRPIFYRLSCVDDLDDGWMLDDTLVLSRHLQTHGVDVIDASSRGLGRRGTPVVFPREPGFQVPYAESIRQAVSMPTCAVGLIMDFDQANTIIEAGKADLVAIGREALRNPNWAAQAAVALLGNEAYETHWQPRWGWWLVRRAASLEAYQQSTQADV
jgi:2,4-dienoyl-CoA reductase-like NADH-dependent reductase (Old Yellow Enzyme family)